MLKLWKSQRHIRGDPPITVLNVVDRVASVLLSGHVIARVYADSNSSKGMAGTGPPPGGRGLVRGHL